MSQYDYLKDASVLITGGTGSLGKMLTKVLLTKAKPHKVIIFSRDEWKQWDMRNNDPLYQDPAIRYFIGDVRDYKRLMRAFNEVDYVIHAAALKQVPVAEYNPTEFVETNVNGAMNVINAAVDSRIKSLIALSTDKAVNPVNLYGATKLCSDKLFVSGNSYVGRIGEPRMSVVRYGNVLGSRGSIIPLWEKMIADGAKFLPITDVRMTRFWITLEQAAEFVLSCLGTNAGGEIYVPKIPSMRITDLAEAMAPNLPHEIIGIRPGEKLHEQMISQENAYHTLDCPDRYIIVPAFRITDKKYLDKTLHNKPLKLVPEDFEYASDTNDQWLDKKTLRSLLA